jgi:hypothetical protein
VLRTDGRRLTTLTHDSQAIRALRASSRTRKQLVESGVRLVSQLRAELDRCFPGASGLFTRLDSDVAIPFLCRYPTQHAAMKLTRARFAAFLSLDRLHRPQPVEDLCTHVTAAPAAAIGAIEADGHAARPSGARTRSEWLSGAGLLIGPI